MVLWWVSKYIDLARTTTTANHRTTDMSVMRCVSWDDLHPFFLNRESSFCTTVSELGSQAPSLLPFLFLLSCDAPSPLFLHWNSSSFLTFS